MATARWIQDARIKRGALSHDLGIPEAKKIPVTLLRTLHATPVGTLLVNPTKTGEATIRVTPRLKRRVSLALTLKRLPRKGNMSRTNTTYKTGSVRRRSYQSVDLDYGIASELGVDGTDRITAEAKAAEKLAADPDYYQKIRKMEDKFFRRKHRR
jgi:hypothetical protein